MSHIRHRALQQHLASLKAELALHQRADLLYDRASESLDEASRHSYRCQCGYSGPRLNLKKAAWLSDHQSKALERMVKNGWDTAWTEGAESAFFDPETRDQVDYPESPYAELPILHRSTQQKVTT